MLNCPNTASAPFTPLCEGNAEPSPFQGLLVKRLFSLRTSQADAPGSASTALPQLGPAPRSWVLLPAAACRKSQLNPSFPLMPLTPRFLSWLPIPGCCRSCAGAGGHNEEEEQQRRMRRQRELALLGALHRPQPGTIEGHAWCAGMKQQSAAMLLHLDASPVLRFQLER